MDTPGEGLGSHPVSKTLRFRIWNLLTLLGLIAGIIVALHPFLESGVSHTRQIQLHNEWEQQKEQYQKQLKAESTSASQASSSTAVEEAPAVHGTPEAAVSNVSIYRQQQVVDDSDTSDEQDSSGRSETDPLTAASVAAQGKVQPVTRVVPPSPPSPAPAVRLSPAPQASSRLIEGGTHGAALPPKTVPTSTVSSRTAPTALRTAPAAPRTRPAALRTGPISAPPKKTVAPVSRGVVQQPSVTSPVPGSAGRASNRSSPAPSTSQSSKVQEHTQRLKGQPLSDPTFSVSPVPQGEVEADPTSSLEQLLKPGVRRVSRQAVLQLLGNACPLPAYHNVTRAAGRRPFKKRVVRRAVDEGLIRLLIPRLRLDAIVLPNVTRVALTQGPGHFPETALPWEIGNCVIGGHRNTWGNWFMFIHQLRPGDRVILETMRHEYYYRVTGQQLVWPTDVSILRDHGSRRELTLVTCNVGAQKRVVVRSVLQSIGPPLD